jgi:hypothetical protein
MSETVLDQLVRSVFYILVQGDVKFASHCAVTSLSRVLWLLSWRSVPPENVKPFMKKVDDMQNWPLRAPGQGSFQIPADYSGRLDDRRDHIAGYVRAAIDDACRRADVRSIVLIYVDHGKRDLLEAAPFGQIKPNDFDFWATICANAGKSFLTVIEACYSTIFAQQVWERMNRAGRAQAQFLDRHVGFITSARGDSFTSAILVSRWPDLVNVFGTARIEQNLVNGFMIRNAMFSRRFHQLLAYGLPVDHNRTVGQFVDMMKQASFLTSQVIPEFVGGSEFAKIPFEFFFPGEPIVATSAAPGWGDLTFGDVIPSEALGTLFDDESNCGKRVIVMELNENGQPSASPNELTVGGLPRTHRIILRLALRRSLRRAEEALTPSGVELWMIWYRFGQERVNHNIMDPQRGATFEESQRLKEFLERELQVEVPVGPCLGSVAAYGTVFESWYSFEEKVAEVTRDIAAELKADPTSWGNTVYSDDDDA